MIPEVYGWLAPCTLDLYAHHRDRAGLDASRASHGLLAPDELWVCTTEGARAQQSLDDLTDWWRRLGRPLPLRLWTAAGTDQLATGAECAHFRELAFRLMLRAAEWAGADGQIVLSLAGGRKTMSADLQAAGTALGATAWLHVVGPEPLPEGLTKPSAATFLQALPPELAGAVMPLVVGSGVRSEMLDVEFERRHVTAATYPLPDASPGEIVRWALPPGAPLLHADLASRQRAGQRWLGNQVAQQARQDAYETWPSLYRLPAGKIEQLRGQALVAADRDLLRRMPKADLHRHLGGCLDLVDQQAAASAIWQALAPAERDQAMAVAGPLLASDALGQAQQVKPRDWHWQWPQSLHGAHRAAASAALLLHAAPAQLQHELYGRTEPRVALKARSTYGFAAYERPGELSGSALLSHPAAIAPYAQALVAQARAEGLALVELRGSPQKYRPSDPLAFLRELEAALHAAGAQTRGFDPTHGGPRIGFLWILDRRQRESIASVVRQAVDARGALGGFLLGLDLAGDEGTQAPEQLAPAFAPAFEACMPVTIHAGEGESAENIWQAAYHLHADRIGHGLTLVDRPDLAQRFRDRGIALELCPSSNREVVGFHDPAFEASADCPVYPLQKFIRAGLPFALCTDNPGISRTTLADEYLVASRMSPDGLRLWEALAISRQAFTHAFVPAAEREALRRSVEQDLFSLLSDPASAHGAGPKATSTLPSTAGGTMAAMTRRAGSNPVNAMATEGPE